MSSNFENESQVKNRLAMEQLVTKAVIEGIERAKRCCFNCASFREQHLFCIMHNAAPPPRVVAFGCDTYTPSDEIPF